MILIMPITLVLLARIIVQVSASNVRATMTVTTHQQQVFSQVWPVVDFKLMPFPPFARKLITLLAYIIVDIWGPSMRKTTYSH